MRHVRRQVLVLTLPFAVAISLAIPSASAETVGVWLTREEVQELPMSGRAWENVKRAADGAPPQAQVSDPISLHDTAALAVALVALRTGDPAYRRKAADAINSAIGTENGPLSAGSRHLPIARNTTAYVIAADLIDLRSYDRALDERFRAWIRGLRDSSYDGEPPVRLIQEERSNNHGTMAGAARAAVSAYLGDAPELARTAQVLRGWMGDRASHSWPLSGFHEGSATFMPDPSQPRPVNPAGLVVQGHDMDGAQPQELARCGLFAWPPCQTPFPWGGLAGSVVAAEILRRNGYPDVFQWENRAVLRAYQWLDRMSRVDRFWWSEATTGDDSWQPWLANFVYGTSFPGVSPTKPGRNMGWTDWTHAGRTVSGGRALYLPPDSGAVDRSAPVLRGLRVQPRRFRAVRRGRTVAATPRGAGGGRRGAWVSYTLSEDAAVRFRLRRARPGRRAGSRCVARTRRNRGARPCVRWVRVRGGFSHAGHAGPNRFRFNGRLRGRRLRPLRYRIVARPTDPAGNRGRAARAAFRVVRR